MNGPDWLDALALTVGYCVVAVIWACLLFLAVLFVSTLILETIPAAMRRRRVEAQRRARILDLLAAGGTLRGLR